MSSIIPLPQTWCVLFEQTCYDQFPKYSIKLHFLAINRNTPGKLSHIRVNYIQFMKSIGLHQLPYNGQSDTLTTKLINKKQRDVIQRVKINNIN